MKSAHDTERFQPLGPPLAPQPKEPPRKAPDGPIVAGPDGKLRTNLPMPAAKAGS